MEQQVTPEEYENMVKEQCPFCKIVDGKIPAKIVYEDSKVIAFLDINPASPGHTLIVPRKHYTVIPQMSDGDVAHIFKLARNIAGLLFEITQRSSKEKPAGVNIIQNNGAAAGQQVPHIHVHVIPRLEGDGVIQPWQPKQMEEKNLDEMQAILKANIRPVIEKADGPKEVVIPGLSQPEPIAQPTPQPVPQPMPQPMPPPQVAPQPEEKKDTKKKEGPPKKEEPQGLPKRKPRRP